jgi:starch phosphorylase
LLVPVPVRGVDVWVQIWRVDVGRVPLYLLDTDRPENRRIDRWITSRLYEGDLDVRLAQYALLGRGGVRALQALGIEPSVLHLNEGHAGLATLNSPPAKCARGAVLRRAAAVRARTVSPRTPGASGQRDLSDAIVRAHRTLRSAVHRLGQPVRAGQRRSASPTAAGG